MEETLRIQKLAIRMAVVWFVLFTLVSLCNSIITAFYGLRWAQMDTQDRLIVGFLILANWGTIMMAFLSKAMTRAQAGQFPIETGDTSLLKRTSEVKQVTTAVTTLETPPKDESV